MTCGKASPFNSFQAGGSPRPAGLSCHYRKRMREAEAYGVCWRTEEAMKGAGMAPPTHPPLSRNIGLIADGESLAHKPRVFHLIHDRDGEILGRDVALAIGVDDEKVPIGAVPSRAFPRRNPGGRTHDGPV